MVNGGVIFLVKIPIRCWFINKTRQGITFICRTLYRAYRPNGRLCPFPFLFFGRAAAKWAHEPSPKTSNRLLIGIFV